MLSAGAMGILSGGRSRPRPRARQRGAGKGALHPAVMAAAPGAFQGIAAIAFRSGTSAEFDTSRRYGGTLRGLPIAVVSRSFHRTSMGKV